jgi:hypothetical protein
MMWFQILMVRILLCVYNSVNGAVYTAIISTERRQKLDRIKGFSDFVHRPDSTELEDKNMTFRKLDLFPSSGEGRHLLCWVPYKELTSITGVTLYVRTQIFGSNFKRATNYRE